MIFFCHHEKEYKSILERNQLEQTLIGGVSFLKCLYPCSLSEMETIYDWERDTLAEWHSVPIGGIVLVEGCYALRNELTHAYDFTIWLECPRAIRLARGIARNGESMRAIWENNWMLAEDLYREQQRPWERADIVVDSSGELPHNLEQEYVYIV
jgi:dephospho-CoA kinase